MLNRTVSQARSFKQNPNHFPRKLNVRIYNALSRTQPKYPLPKNPKRILIQCQEKIGDGILVFPLLYGLNKIFPNLNIDLLCSKHNRSIFKRLPYVKKLFIYKNGKKLWKDLASNKYDLFYNTKDHPSITSFKIAKHVNAKVKVCISNIRHNQHYNYALKNSNVKTILEKNALLLKEYDQSIKIKSWLDLSGNQSKNNDVCINISAGSPYREWSLKKWIDLINMIFINDKSTKINIIAMNKDQDKINLIKKKIGYPMNFYSNFNNILDSVRILSKSKVLISPDTAMIHLADAAKIKILGLYSADNLNVEKYSPLFSKYKILQSDTLRLKNIETEKVFIEYRKLIME